MAAELFASISREEMDMMPKKKARKRASPPNPALIKRVPQPGSKARAAKAAQIHQNIFASDWCQENKAPN
jgi:hypothetical protein